MIKKSKLQSGKCNERWKKLQSSNRLELSAGLRFLMQFNKEEFGLNANAMLQNEAHPTLQTVREMVKLHFVWSLCAFPQLCSHEIYLFLHCIGTICVRNTCGFHCWSSDPKLFAIMDQEKHGSTCCAIRDPTSRRAGAVLWNLFVSLLIVHIIFVVVVFMLFERKGSCRKLRSMSSWTPTADY